MFLSTCLWTCPEQDFFNLWSAKTHRTDGFKRPVDKMWGKCAPHPGHPSTHAHFRSDQMSDWIFSGILTPRHHNGSLAEPRKSCEGLRMDEAAGPDARDRRLTDMFVFYSPGPLSSAQRALLDTVARLWNKRALNKKNHLFVLSFSLIWHCLFGLGLEDWDKWKPWRNKRFKISRSWHQLLGCSRIWMHRDRMQISLQRCKKNDKMTQSKQSRV